MPLDPTLTTPVGVATQLPAPTSLTPSGTIGKSFVSQLQPLEATAGVELHNHSGFPPATLPGAVVAGGAGFGPRKFYSAASHHNSQFVTTSSVTSSLPTLHPSLIALRQQQQQQEGVDAPTHDIPRPRLHEPPPSLTSIYTSRPPLQGGHGVNRYKEVPGASHPHSWLTQVGMASLGMNGETRTDTRHVVGDGSESTGVRGELDRLADSSKIAVTPPDATWTDKAKRDVAKTGTKRERSGGKKSKAKRSRRDKRSTHTSVSAEGVIPSTVATITAAPTSQEPVLSYTNQRSGGPSLPPNQLALASSQAQQFVAVGAGRHHPLTSDQSQHVIGTSPQHTWSTSQPLLTPPTYSQPVMTSSVHSLDSSLHTTMELPRESSRTSRLSNSAVAYPHISAAVSTLPLRSGYGSRSALLASSENPLPTTPSRLSAASLELVRPVSGGQTNRTTPTTGMVATPTSGLSTPISAVDFGCIRVKKEPGLSISEDKEAHIPRVSYVLINAHH